MGEGEEGGDRGRLSQETNALLADIAKGSESTRRWLLAIAVCAPSMPLSTPLSLYPSLSIPLYLYLSLCTSLLALCALCLNKQVLFLAVARFTNSYTSAAACGMRVCVSVSVCVLVLI